jgi:hypothetical protein
MTNLSKTWFNNAWIREQLNLPKQRTKVSGDLHLEVAALKAERDKLKEWCRKLIEGGTFPGEADGLRAERDELNRAYQQLLDVNEDNIKLRAALEEMLIIKPRDEAEAAFHRIARRALEGK